MEVNNRYATDSEDVTAKGWVISACGGYVRAVGPGVIIRLDGSGPEVRLHAPGRTTDQLSSFVLL